jgi:N-acetylglucosaminyl-diphospho-decaprenol L-rhamnosyltransferase
MHTLSIIILQHNSPEATESCLRALQQAWLPEKTEIIVVNNGGNQANGKISKEAHQNLKVKFFDIPNKGYPNGNNFGIQHADGKFVAFINPDIITEKDTLKILLDYLEKHSEVGIVAPRLVYPDGTIQDNYRVFPRFLDLIIKRTPFLRKFFPQRMREYLMWDKEPAVNEAVDWVTGAFEVIRRETLEKVGFHDEKYFLFMSDIVLCRKAWEAGYEVHFVGNAQAFHSDERLSSGGFLAFFKKRVLRIHVNDAIKYYFGYLGKGLPAKSPSLSKIQKKDRLLRARMMSGTSALTKIGKKLQRKNPVVTVYSGRIQGKKEYMQPVIFFDTGVVGVIRNKEGKIGLMRTWRHIPLSFHKKNTFPIFPDVGNLGMWSYECPRGGIEKRDSSPEEAVKRELLEEIGLGSEHIVSMRPLGNIVGNTAIDVYHHKCFEITVSSDFVFTPGRQEEVETIKDLVFLDENEIKKLIDEKKLFCGISQAAVLQAAFCEN